MSILDAVIQGLVGGLSTFLPVSSSGHLAVLRNLFNMPGGEAHMLLDGMIHMGALIAMLFMSWSEIKRMLRETSLAFRGVARPKGHPGIAAARLQLLVLAASVPALLIIPIGKYVLSLSSGTLLVGAMLVLNGFILMIYLKFTVDETLDERRLGMGSALMIGICRCVSFLPGMSGMATGMTAAASAGASHRFAVRFALLCSVPALLGMTIYEIVVAASYGIDPTCIPAYIIGMVCAMVTSVLAIGIMRTLAKRKSFGGFAYYCWIVGALTVILSMIF